VTVHTEEELRSALTTGAYIILAADIALEEELKVDSSMKGVTVDGQKQFSLDGGGECHVFSMNGGGLLLQDLTVSNGFSQTSNGAGVYHSGGDLAIAGCTFAGNKAPNGVGGGLWSTGASTVSIANTTFVGNQANYGGGMFSSITTTMAAVTFQNNVATSFGGGMRVSGGQLALDRVSFVGNSVKAATSTGAGGGLSITSGTVTLTNALFDSNTAPLTGGALQVSSQWPVVTLVDYTFSGNAAASGSDVYYSSSASPKLYSGCIAGKYSDDTNQAALSCMQGSPASACPVASPASASSAACSTCPSADPFSCCGAVSEAGCEAAEPTNCAAPNAAVCP
jgi:hypothetical protein